MESVGDFSAESVVEHRLNQTNRDGTMIGVGFNGANSIVEACVNECFPTKMTSQRLSDAAERFGAGAEVVSTVSIKESPCGPRDLSILRSDRTLWEFAREMWTRWSWPRVEWAERNSSCIFPNILRKRVR